MKPTASLLCVGLLMAGGTALAQETREQPTHDEHTATPTPQPEKSPASKQFEMKDCMERERTGDSSMSPTEARRNCQEALRAQRENHDNEPQMPRHH